MVRAGECMHPPGPEIANHEFGLVAFFHIHPHIRGLFEAPSEKCHRQDDLAGKGQITSLDENL